MIVHDLSSCEEMLREIAVAEEELILYDKAYINGVEITAANKDKLESLKALWEKRRNDILNQEITIEMCDRYIKLYLEAEEEILKSQSYTIDGQTLTRANLNDIVRQRKNWENQKEILLSGEGNERRIYRLSHNGD
ncbi:MULTISPECIES: hypothetical protein [unclassified Fusobacterium]|uniref:hypothetical protein n=1 Tax=unclassified Fusobacterium TaxID=2648384 RepID=UPI001B8CD3B3|nr:MULTISPECIES: hypothetical protein [unclassified Fusobacterium]MBR8701449.1 hypothetical protein [Fusobacterium sp. DD45]MBR8711217.1 hypothetical protein [Fusobacterium sp. DD28]MBR8751790.1 hypothetical protein [Fusobacterium sp. DD26]